MVNHRWTLHIWVDCAKLFQKVENVQREGEFDLRKWTAAKEISVHQAARVEETMKGEQWKIYKIMSPSELVMREKLFAFPASWQLGAIK